MGNCANNPQNEDLIQEYLAVTKQKDPDHTILILGTSNSGKSIIFRHIESLYDKDTNHYIQDIIIAFAHESHLSKWVPSDIVNLCTNFLNPLEIKEFNEEGDETGTKHYTRKENKDIVQYLGNYETSQQLIRHNCISAMMTLYNKCEEFSTEPYNLDECAIDPNDEEIANTIKTILPYTDVQDFDRTFNRGHAEEYAQLGMIYNVDSIINAVDTI